MTERHIQVQKMWVKSSTTSSDMIRHGYAKDMRIISEIKNR